MLTNNKGLKKFKEQIVTCDPIDNSKRERFLQLVEVLDFDAEIRNNSGDKPADNW